MTDYLCSNNICNSIALHLTPDPAGHVEEERLDDDIDGDDDEVMVVSVVVLIVDCLYICGKCTCIMRVMLIHW